MAKQNEVAYISCTNSRWLQIAVEKAVKNAGGKLLLLDLNIHIHKSDVTIRDLLSHATAILVDLTKHSSEIMFTVGMAQTLGKPIIPLATSFADLPTNLRSIQFLSINDFQDEGDFVNRLSSLLGDVFNNPGKYSYESAVEAHRKKQNIFISYSRKDKEYLDRLLVHMSPLKKQGILDLWVDTHLRVGDKWKENIEKALESATAAILIISADFLASDFIVDNELPPLLKSAEEKGTRIFPLIAKPCRFTRDPNLKYFQAINDPKDALVLLDLGHQEKVLDDLCAEVEKYVS